MSCDHCRIAITDEVAQVAGVEDVAVDVAVGRIEVTGSDFADDEIAAAVAEAGYALGR